MCKESSLPSYKFLTTNIPFSKNIFTTLFTEKNKEMNQRLNFLKLSVLNTLQNNALRYMSRMVKCLNLRYNAIYVTSGV